MQRREDNRTPLCERPESKCLIPPLNAVTRRAMRIRGRIRGAVAEGFSAEYAFRREKGRPLDYEVMMMAGRIERELTAKKGTNA